MIPVMANAIGIDVGTTNVKVALVRGDGTTVASAQRALPMTRSGDQAEQDADAMWTALGDAIREITTAHPADAAGGAVGRRLQPVLVDRRRSTRTRVRSCRC